MKTIQDITNKKVELNQVIKLLNSEMWYPENPTREEIAVSAHLNMILADIITKLYRL